jgi:hypothetical protein
MDEYMDVEFEGPIKSIPAMVENINRVLPVGLKVLSARFISLKLPPVSAIIRAQKYTAFLKGEELHIKDIDGVLRERPIAEVEREGKKKFVDLSSIIEEAALKGDRFSFTLKKGVSGIKPLEAARHILELPPESSLLIPIIKTKTILSGQG